MISTKQKNYETLKDQTSLTTSKNAKQMKFDDIYAEIGDFGPYQKRVCFLTSLIHSTVAILTLSGVFIMAKPEHRCAIPGLTNDTYRGQGHWHTYLINKTIPFNYEDNMYSECNTHNGNPYRNALTNSTQTCKSWVYSKKTFDRTVVSDLDLVCGEKHLVTYANMILMAGQLCGSLIFGSLSDVIGRKKVLLIAILGMFVASSVTTFSQSYEMYVITRFFTTFFSIGALLVSFVLGMEIVGPAKRKYAELVFFLFWPIGIFILTGLAYGIRDWRYLQAATALPCVLLLSYWWLLPESPRWLMYNKKQEEAIKIIKSVAKGNGIQLSDNIQQLKVHEMEGPGEKIWHLFTEPVLLIRSLIIFVNWMVIGMVYYGVSLGVGSLPGDIYLNFFIFAVVEFFSCFVCILLMDILGRKPLLCISMLVGGVASILAIFQVIFNAPAWITVTLVMVGKFGASMAFTVIFIFSAELFPTVVRNSGMGLSSLCARIGSIAGPYIADIGYVVGGDLGVTLPLIIYGGASVAAGLLALYLPETLGRTLPDSVEDAKNFAHQNKSSGYPLKDSDKHTKSGNKNEGFAMDK